MEENRTIAISRYYGSMKNMHAKYDKRARQDAFLGSSLEDFEAWRKKTKTTLVSLLGLSNMESAPLEPVVLEEVTLVSGIRRRKVLIQTEPEVYMPIYILIPPHADKNTKVFICPPGHQGAGKYSVAGCEEIPAVKDAIKKFHYDYGMQLCRLGFVAVCPDCRGFGERRDEYLQKDDETSFLRSSCFQLAHAAEALGETVIGMCVWDLMRLTDYLESLTEWDTRDLSCLGFSGGGMQTLYFSVLDDRIKTVVISGYLYGMKDSLLLLNNNCSCNYVPHLMEHFDMGDIASLIAPRPCMIQSCREDHLNGPRGLENVYEQMDVMKRAYALYHADNLLLHDICEGGHCWHEEALEKKLSILGRTSKS